MPNTRASAGRCLTFVVAGTLALCAPAGADAPSAAASVPVTVANGHVFVDVRIEGAGPFTFAFDTGAGNTITPQVAARVGIRTTGSFRIGGTGESAERGSNATIASVDVGSAHLVNQHFTVASLDALRAADGVPHFDGIVGRELLEKYVATLDYGAHTLTLADPADYRAPSGVREIPLKLDGGAAEISATVDGVDGTFMLDTGDRGSLTLMEPFAKAHGFPSRYRRSPDAITGWGFGGPVHSQLIRVDRFAFGPFAFDGIVTRLPTGTSGLFATSTLAGNIGSGILSRFTVTFDYPHRELGLIPDSAYAEADRYDRSGLWLTQGASGFDVAGVTPESAAARASVAVGDTVVAVDGRDARTLALPDLRRDLSDPQERIVTLTLARAGLTRTVTLALADIV